MKEIVKDPAKEQRILKASVSLFSQNGYQATKTDDIAAQAEVSKGLIFHYFGNKAALYLAVYNYATTLFYQVMNTSVWTEAADLIDMVVRATKYKISLQLQYPMEFSFLSQVYSELPHLPQELKVQLSNDLEHQFKDNIGLADPVIERLPLKEGVVPQDVKELLTDVLNAESVRIQKELAAHPEWKTIEAMEPLILRMKRKLSLLEHGFVK